MTSDCCFGQQNAVEGKEGQFRAYISRGLVSFHSVSLDTALCQENSLG